MQPIDSVVARTERPGKESNKYLLFSLAGETFGLSLLQLHEVLAEYEISVLPSLPESFLGVVGLRGNVIPILNLRQRFGFEDRERDRNTRVIIADLEPNPIGIQVDEVLRVEPIAPRAIDEPPELTCGQTVPFVTGVSDREDGTLVIHLDIELLLSSLEQIQLAEISAEIREAHAAKKATPLAAVKRKRRKRKK